MSFPRTNLISMPIKVIRQPKENTQNLVRRFTKGVKRSGILIRAKQARFKKNPKNKRAKKLAALRREELTKKYERLYKLGKL